MSNIPKCVVIGGGGHARVVIDCLRVAGDYEPVAILDTNRALWGTQVDGVPVAGDDAELPRLRNEGVRHFAIGTGQAPRVKLFQMALSAGLQPASAIHPRAVIASSVRIGAGAQIFACAVVNPGASLGDNVLINTAAVVEHDCVLADHVVVASNACLLGAVQVEEDAMIGAGSTVRQGLRVGAHSIVGAGAMVTKDVLPGKVVVGVPARELR